MNILTPPPPSNLGILNEAASNTAGRRAGGNTDRRAGGGADDHNRAGADRSGRLRPGKST